MPKEMIYGMSFRCYYKDTTQDIPKYTNHYQELPLKDIQKWIECYRFTHPDCTSITVKVWFNTPEAGMPQDETTEAEEAED